MKTVLSLIVIIAFITISCSSEKKGGGHEESHDDHGTKGIVVLNQRQRQALKLELGTFQMRNLTTVVKTNGQLEVPPASRADVTTVIGGNVKEIKVFHGDKVVKGQPLAVLEHPDYISLQEEFAELAHRLEFLEKEYSRQKELFDNNVGAGKDYQQVKADFNTAKARFAGLKLRLEFLNISPDKVIAGNITKSIDILSPINGYINDVDIKVGTYVDAENKLFSISDNSAIHADFMVFENDVHLLKIGQKIDFTVSNRPGEELSAVIFAIGNEFESNTRSVHIHANLTDNPGNLIPGMYISGHIHTDINFTRTLPDGAIVTEGTKSYIFVLDNEDVAEHGHDEHGKEESHEGHSHDEKAEEESHEGHSHDEKAEEEGHEGHSHDGHNEADGDNQNMSFRMVEVITGQKDGGHTEIKLLDSLPDNTQIVFNAAYYLLADLKKEETEHNH